MSVHRFEVRVYYEDTDLAGVVYYANYLKFIERARSEMLRAAGVDQTRMKLERGLVFVVRRVEIDYRSSARFDDLLTIETRVLKLGGARVVLSQTVARSAEPQTPLATSVVEVACVNADGRPERLPTETRAVFAAALAQEASSGADA